MEIVMYFVFSSNFGGTNGWNLMSVIFKGGDDLRQEVLAMQLIFLCAEVFENAHLPLR